MSSSSYVDPVAGAVEYCETQSQQSTGYLSEQYYSPMASYCAQKLWHQLTVCVLQFVHDPRITQLQYFALYDRVVCPVANHLDSLQLGRIAAAVANALAPTDRTAAKAVLEKLLVLNTNTNTNETSSTSNNSKKDSTTPQLSVAATILVQSQLALLQLQQQQDHDFLYTTMKDQIRFNESRLLQQDLPAVVHAAHYEQAMTYYKVVGPPEAYFAQAMRFLQYAPPPSTDTTTAASGVVDMPAILNATSTFTNYQQLALDLVVAALTGDGVYNLSQVVHEQSTLLQQYLAPTHAWLVELVVACAAGRVRDFRAAAAGYAAVLATQPALVARAAAVQEKLTLLALVDLILTKPAHERQLTFYEIAQHCVCTGMDQVEWIVMRAISVGLIVASIDQVSELVQVSWVVPMILSATQLQDLAARFGEWADKVRRTKELVQEQTATFV
jgi:26S proteasome regulatory subunit N9